MKAPSSRTLWFIIILLSIFLLLILWGILHQPYDYSSQYLEERARIKKEATPPPEEQTNFNKVGKTMKDSF